MPNFTHHTQEFYLNAFARAVTLHGEGNTYAEIAEATQVHVRTIGLWLRDGKKIHPDTITQAKLDKAHEILKHGASYREAAQRSGVSDSTLKKKFPELGWTKEQSLEYMQAVKRMSIDYNLDKYLA